MYVTYVSELKCNYLPLTEDTESMSDRSAPWMPSCLFMRLKSTNISLKIRKSERDNEKRAAAEMGIGYRRGSTAARRCHRPEAPAAQTTAAGISPCKNHGISAKIISWNIHLKTKRHSQFIQVLHNCNFYDSTICHQDAEDGGGQWSGPHVRMQLHNCPLPSIQFIVHWELRSTPACSDHPPSPHGSVSDVALVVATLAPAMPRSRLPILRVCSMKDQTMRICKNILTNKITFTQEKSIMNILF